MLLNKFIMVLVVSGAMTGMVGCCENYDKCATTIADNNNQSENTAKQEENIAPPIDASVAKKVIHFAYNKYDLNTESEAIITALTKELLDKPNLVLRLVGHTDARGSQKYNLALGMLRAKAVAKSLVLHGVAADRITTSSYGKAQPIATGNDEDAYSQNRRVEFFIEGNN